MRHRILPLLFLVLGCKGQTPDEETDTDTDTDADADTDTDADADVDVLEPCLASLDVDAGVAGATTIDANPVYEWDQGWAVSACFVPDNPGVGRAHVYMRVVDGGPTDTYCGATYSVTTTPVTPCDSCDLAFSLALVETSSIDVLAPNGDTNCSYLEEVVIPTFGVELDSEGPYAWTEANGEWSIQLDGSSDVQVDELDGVTRVDWLWQEFRSLD
ncbi:MAG: hypothetical protein R3F61_23805 [Myxococcota bacterium]